MVAQVNRASAFMPPGVLLPQIMRMDPGSVPIGYLTLTSESTSPGMLTDLAEYRIRPLIEKEVPGTVGTAPFGANVRSIVITLDPDRLRSYNLTPEEVTKALMAGNLVIPSGNLYIKDQMPFVPTNAVVDNVQKIGQIPLRAMRNLYIRDVATISDATDINYGFLVIESRLRCCGILLFLQHCKKSKNPFPSGWVPLLCGKSHPSRDLDFVAFLPYQPPSNFNVRNSETPQLRAGSSAGDGLVQGLVGCALRETAFLERTSAGL